MNTLTGVVKLVSGYLINKRIDIFFI